MLLHLMLALEDEKEVTHTKLQQTKCMNSKGKLTFCIINSDKPCISTQLGDLIYGEVEKIQVLKTETIHVKPGKGTNGTRWGARKESYETLLL